VGDEGLFFIFFSVLQICKATTKQLDTITRVKRLVSATNHLFLKNKWHWNSRDFSVYYVIENLLTLQLNHCANQIPHEKCILTLAREREREISRSEWLKKQKKALKRRTCIWKGGIFEGKTESIIYC